MEDKPWHYTIGSDKKPSKQTAYYEGMGHLSWIKMYACKDKSGNKDSYQASKLKILTVKVGLQSSDDGSTKDDFLHEGTKHTDGKVALWQFEHFHYGIAYCVYSPRLGYLLFEQGKGKDYAYGKE